MIFFCPYNFVLLLHEQKALSITERALLLQVDTGSSNTGIVTGMLKQCSGSDRSDRHKKWVFLTSL